MAGFYGEVINSVSSLSVVLSGTRHIIIFPSCLVIRYWFVGDTFMRTTPKAIKMILIH